MCFNPRRPFSNQRASGMASTSPFAPNAGQTQAAFPFGTHNMQGPNVATWPPPAAPSNPYRSHSVPWNTLHFVRGTFEPQIKEPHEVGQIVNGPHIGPWEFPMKEPDRLLQIPNCFNTNAGPTYGKDRFFVVAAVHPGNTHMILIEINTNGGKNFGDKHPKPSTWPRHINMCEELKLSTYEPINTYWPKHMTLVVENHPLHTWKVDPNSTVDISRPYTAFLDTRWKCKGYLTDESMTLLLQEFHKYFGQLCGIPTPVPTIDILEAAIVDTTILQALSSVIATAKEAGNPQANLLARFIYDHQARGQLPGHPGGFEHDQDVESSYQENRYVEEETRGMEDGYNGGDFNDAGGERNGNEGGLNGNDGDLNGSGDVYDGNWIDDTKYTEHEYNAYLIEGDEVYNPEFEDHSQDTKDFTTDLNLATQVLSQSIVAVPSSPPVQGASEDTLVEPITPRPTLSSSITGSYPSTPITPAEQSIDATSVRVPAVDEVRARLQGALIDLRDHLDNHDPRFDLTNDFPRSDPVSTVDAHLGSIDQYWGSEGSKCPAPWQQINPPVQEHRKHAVVLLRGEEYTLRSVILERFVYMKAKEMADERETAQANQGKGGGGNTGTIDGVTAALRFLREQ